MLLIYCSYRWLSCSNQVASREDVLGVNGLLQSLQDIDAGVSHTPRQETLSDLADPMVMRDAPTIFHDLIPGGLLDLSVGAHRVA